MTAQFSRPSAIVLDIEGTTTDIKFVSKVLFPFIRSHLKHFLNDTWDERNTKEIVSRLRIRAKEDANTLPRVPLIATKAEPTDVIVASIDRYVVWQMSEKRRSDELICIQILVWLWGYDRKYIKGHVFDDVPKAMHVWRRKMNIKLYIYSSGVAVAQKLLFSASIKGNLYILIDDFFDNNIGNKKDAESYKRIANNIGIRGNDILFITDSPEEAKSAINAGWKSCLIKRPGNRPLKANEGIPVVSSFKDIRLA